MHDDQTQFESPAEFPADAPPTEAGDFVPVTPPEGWPTVVGVLSIIFGALGALGGGCSLMFLLFAPLLLNLLPPDQQWQDVRDAIQQSMQSVSLQVGMNALEFLVSIILLVGGVQLIKRKAKAAKTLTVFAIADLFSNTVGAVGGVLVANAQLSAMSEEQGAPAVAQTLGTGVTMLFAAVGWILYAIWPVFLLLWFRRAKIRESMDSWGDGPADPAYTVR